VLTVEQARRKALALLAEVLEGADPSGARRQARTFAELAETYLEQHSAPRKRSARDDVQRIRDYLIPAWGPRSATAVSRADVAELHREIGDRGTYVANRVLALVSHLFAWGEKVGLLPESHPNPVRGISRFRERPRDRWLGRDEVRRLLKALEKEPSVHIRAFFWLLLLTGCRKRELLELRWEDVDLEQGVARLPETKAGRVHHVPLSAQAILLFRSLPRESGNPHVFPGRIAGAPLVNVEKSWRRIRDDAGLGDVRLHDLRRTVGSWLVQDGASLPLVGAVLNHSNPSTTQVYAHLAEPNRRLALERLGDAITAAVSVPTQEETVG
jgi:integrase